MILDLATFALDGDDAIEELVRVVDQALERGGPIPAADLERTIGRFVAMPASVHDVWAQAQDLATRLSASFANDGTLIDVGGGLGSYTAALLAAAPHARAVLFDLPSVTNTARRFLVGFGNRVSVREVDLLTENLPQLGGRVALVADLLHVLAPAETPRLLRNVHAALQPGGQIVIVEIDPDSLRGHLFRLVAWLRGLDLRLHDEAALSTHLQSAGFSHVKQIPSSAPWQPLVLAASKAQGGVDLFGID